MGLEFDLGNDTRCNLYVRLERAGDGSRQEDIDGNLWREYRVCPEVSWSSYGGSPPAIALRRLAFISAIAQLASGIESLFGTIPIWDLAATKEEREAAARQAAARKVYDRAKALIADSRKGLKVGGVVAVTIPSLEPGLPAGDYQDDFQGRTYILSVAADGATGSLRRTA
jgi:hypothetical protein